MNTKVSRAVLRAACIGVVVATLLGGSGAHPVFAGEPWGRTGTNEAEIADYMESVTQLSKDSGQSEGSIIAQDKLRSQADAALEVATDLPNFAGGYSDRGEGVDYHLYINLVGDEGEDSITALLPRDYPVTFNHVAHSAAEMQSEVARIADKYGKTDVALSLSARDGNTIHAQTPRGVESESARIVEALTEFPITFTDGPAPESTSCSNNTACTPVRGGVQICPQDFHQTWCGNVTLSARGLTVQKTKYFITAGHLGAIEGLYSVDVTHNGSYIGNSSVNSLELASPNSDSRRILSQTPCDNGQFCNRIYLTTSTWTSVTDVKGNAYVQEQDPICKSGWAIDDPWGNNWSGAHCGWWNNYFGNHAIDLNGDHDCLDEGEDCSIEAWGGDFNTPQYPGSGLAGGDSGSSIYYGSWLFGLGADDAGNVSKGPKTQNDIDVLFCLNSDCTYP